MTALYWRVYIEEGVSNPDGPFYIFRLHMAEERHGPSIAVDGVAFASSGDPARAFNAGPDVWLSSSDTPQWIGYQFPNPVDLIEIRIETQGTTAYVPRYPGHFKIQSSDDGETWIDRGEFTNVMFSTNETLTFMVDPIRNCSVLCNILRTSIHNRNSGASAQTGINSYAGDGVISGQIRIQGSPARGRVELFDSQRGILVARTDTNSIGEYSFDNLNRGILYDVIAQDENSQWEKRVSSRRVPIKEG